MKGSSELVEFVLTCTWISVANVMVIQPTVVEITWNPPHGDTREKVKGLMKSVGFMSVCINLNGNPSNS